MSDLRLVTSDGRPVLTPVAGGKAALGPQDVFAFAFGAGHVVASRNGELMKASEAMLQLIDCIRRHCEDAELRTSRAISEPGALL